MAVLVLVLATNTWLGSRNRTAMMDGLEKANVKRALAMTMRTALLEGGVATRNIGLYSDVSAMQQEEERVKAEKKRYTLAQDQLGATDLDESERTLIEGISQLEKKY